MLCHRNTNCCHHFVLVKNQYSHSKYGLLSDSTHVSIWRDHSSLLSIAAVGGSSTNCFEATHVGTDNCRCIIRHCSDRDSTAVFLFSLKLNLNSLILPGGHSAEFISCLYRALLGDYCHVCPKCKQTRYSRWQRIKIVARMICWLARCCEPMSYKFGF